MLNPAGSALDNYGLDEKSILWFVYLIMETGTATKKLLGLDLNVDHVQIRS